MIAVAVSLVAFAFSRWQSSQEELRLKTELERRSGILSESLQESLALLLEQNSLESVKRIVARFSNRERLLGTAVFSNDGNLLVSSSDLADLINQYPQEMKADVNEVVKTKLGYGKFINLGSKRLHSYSVPIWKGQDIFSVLILFHDADYIRDRVDRIWVNNFIRALIQMSLISFITLLMIYLNLLSPIRKTVDWIKRVRLGEGTNQPPPKEKELLGPLAQEVTKMAKSLEMARLTAEQEARLRHSSESLWTADRLKEFVRLKLQGRSLFAISNREPYMHFKKGKEIECIVPASGLVTAIEPILKACGGTWIAEGAGDGDRETVDAHDRLRVPPEEPQYVLRRVWLTKEEEDGYYYGFSNEGLWPLCHIAHTRPIFREENWRVYKAVNEKFAKAVLEEIHDVTEPVILIQDYHFALLPNLIKTKRPDARIAIFWHIPWPNPESFGICPWQKELLQGMLGADLVGFHTQFHCNNFMETVDRALESRIDYEHFTVHREAQKTWVKPFPISIAFESGPATEDFKNPPADAATLLKPYGIQAQWMGVGVDRLDYTKGLVERFRAIESFLEQYPSYRERFTFVELGAPSRTLIPRYQEFIDEIEREVERINQKFKGKNWKPILFLKKHHSHKDIRPFYRAADVCLVTSLHDGMNLVSKEYVMAKSGREGALVLSQFTGASRELVDALIVNPYDIRQSGQAIYKALEMPDEEKRERMKRMWETVREKNIYKWAADLVGELAQIRSV